MTFYVGRHLLEKKAGLVKQVSLLDKNCKSCWRVLVVNANKQFYFEMASVGRMTYCRSEPTRLWIKDTSED